MVFVDSVNDLEYYSPNPQWGCYGDPIFQPDDILLQANGFVSDGSYIITILQCTPDGTIVSDATTNFDHFLASYVFAGTTYNYVNIRATDFTGFMKSNKCFVLRITIIDSVSGDVLFLKYTQKYQIIGSGAVFVPSIYLDNGFTTTALVNCVPGATDENCNKPYIQFKSEFDCLDTFNGDFYGEGMVIAGFGTYPFAFIRKSWIQGRFRKIPNKSKRTVSIRCHTQRTETTQQYLLSGVVTFPVWKMEEVESMLLGARLFVNNMQYQSEGGTIFEQFGKPYNCQYSYKLSMPLQGCFKWQTHGCAVDCASYASYYGFFRPFTKAYDDQAKLIATDTTELEIYFGSLPGAIAVEQLPFVPPCPVDSLFKVQSNGNLPKFIYADEITPAARVYPQILQLNTLDFSSLCNGISNFNQVPIPYVTGYDTELIQVPIPYVTGYDTTDANQYILQVNNEGTWILVPSDTSAQNYLGEVTLNISTATPVTVSHVYSDELIASISGNGIPSYNVVIYATDNPNLPAGSMLVVNTLGEIRFTGTANWDMNNDIIEFFMVRYNIYQ